MGLSPKKKIINQKTWIFYSVISMLLGIILILIGTSLYFYVYYTESKIEEITAEYLQSDLYKKSIIEYSKNIEFLAKQNSIQDAILTYDTAIPVFFTNMLEYSLTEDARYQGGCIIDINGRYIKALSIQNKKELFVCMEEDFIPLVIRTKMTQVRLVENNHINIGSPIFSKGVLIGALSMFYAPEESYKNTVSPYYNNGENIFFVHKIFQYLILGGIVLFCIGLFIGRVFLYKEYGYGIRQYIRNKYMTIDKKEEKERE